MPLAAKFGLEDANVWGATMLRTDDGRTQYFDRLEMPKLHMENGVPTHLFLAGLPRGEDVSFMADVPLTL